jgi:hypothetical protein
MRQFVAEPESRNVPPPWKISDGRVEIRAALWFAARMESAQALRVAREILRNLFAREQLGVTSALPPSKRPSASILKILFAAEPLPLDPEPAPKPRRPGILRALIAREELPESPPGPPRPARHHLLRWLFRPESLDPPP